MSKNIKSTDVGSINIDLNKLICSLLGNKGFKNITTEDIFFALKDQGLEYREGKIVPCAEILSRPNIDVDAMVKRFRQSITPTFLPNSPLLELCLTYYRYGIENALNEIELKNLKQ